jgi:hypothetical protein
MVEEKLNLRVGNVEEIEDKVCWVEVEIDGIIG